MNYVYLKWGKKRVEREETVILDLGSEEDGTTDKSQAAMRGRRRWWSNVPCFKERPRIAERRVYPGSQV